MSRNADAPRVALARRTAVARRMAAQTEAKGRVGGTRALQVQGALHARVLIMGDTVRHWRVANLQSFIGEFNLSPRACAPDDGRGSSHQRAPLYTT